MILTFWAEVQHLRRCRCVRERPEYKGGHRGWLGPLWCPKFWWSFAHEALKTATHHPGREPIVGSRLRYWWGRAARTEFRSPGGSIGGYPEEVVIWSQDSTPPRLKTCNLPNLLRCVPKSTTYQHPRTLSERMGMSRIVGPPKISSATGKSSGNWINPRAPVSWRRFWLGQRKWMYRSMQTQARLQCGTGLDVAVKASFFCSIKMRRDMRGVADYCSRGGSKEVRAGAQGRVARPTPWQTRRGGRLVYWSIDCQRARNVVMPNQSDSLAVIYAMLNLTTTLVKWIGWESTPTLHLARKLSLCVRYLDRTYGHGVGSDGHPWLYPYLSQHLDVPPNF